MKARLKELLSYVSADFGPLIVFWSFDIAFGIKAAIGAAVAFIILDALWRLIRKKPFTAAYLISSALTILFGAIDLLSDNPYMLKYEAVILNIFTGLIFVAGAWGERPILMEIAAQRSKDPIPDNPIVIKLFRGFTILWAGYFLGKAALYFYLGQIMSMERALAIRSAIGTTSLIAMIVLSVVGGKALYTLCERRGWLQPPPAAPTNP